MKRKSLHTGKSLVDRLYDRQRNGNKRRRGQDGSSAMGGLYSQKHAKWRSVFEVVWLTRL